MTTGVFTLKYDAISVEGNVISFLLEDRVIFTVTIQENPIIQDNTVNFKKWEMGEPDDLADLKQTQENARM